MNTCPYCLAGIPTEYNDRIEKNFIFGESYSTEVIKGREYERRVKPTDEYLPLVILGAAQVQKIRDKLNEVFGTTPGMGRRNILNEIVVDIASWWRTKVFQIHLKNTRQSTTSTGHHPKGIAIDLYTPRGMSPTQFRNFIRDECNTIFTHYIIYGWGVHCDWRKK